MDNGRLSSSVEIASLSPTDSIVIDEQLFDTSTFAIVRQCRRTTGEKIGEEEEEKSDQSGGE